MGKDENQFLDDPRPQYKDLVPGVCPKPGRFPQRVKNFDFHKLAGVWIRAIDEKDFASNYTCLSCNFEPLNKTFAGMFMAEQFTESHKEFQLSMNKDFDEDQEYLLDINRFLEFSHKSDPTIGYVRTERQKETRTEEQITANAFDPWLFEQQFLRYGQVVDTDYDNYFIFWSCWEIAEWYTREKVESVSAKKVWDMTKGGEYQDPETSDVLIKFPLPGKDDIHRVALRKTKATIFWRPDYDEQAGKYKFNKKSIDWDKILALRDKVDELFPGLSFKKKNVKQFHHSSCNYDPY